MAVRTELTALVSSTSREVRHRLAEALQRRGWRVFVGSPGGKNGGPEEGSSIALDTSSDRSVAAAASFVARHTDHQDQLVFQSGDTAESGVDPITGRQSFEEIRGAYDRDAIGLLRTVNGFLGLVDHGRMKRLCFLSAVDASINGCTEDRSFAFLMCKAAANMAVAILLNRLRPEGYTFRLYAPESTPESPVAAERAVDYFLRNRSLGAGDPRRADEDRLVLRVWMGREHPW